MVGILKFYLKKIIIEYFWFNIPSLAYYTGVIMMIFNFLSALQINVQIIVRLAQV